MPVVEETVTVENAASEESKEATTAPTNSTANSLPIDPQAYKQFDVAEGENRYYHSVCKSQVDFSFFYDYHVPKIMKVLPE